MLSFLNDWSWLNLSVLSSAINMNAAIILAVTGDVYDLVRLLRYGEPAVTRVMLETFDILVKMHDFSNSDDGFMHAIIWRSIQQNKPELFRFFVVRLDLVIKKERLKDKLEAWYLSSLCAGFLEIFNIFYEQGLLTPDHSFGDLNLPACRPVLLLARGIPFIPNDSLILGARLTNLEERIRPHFLHLRWQSKMGNTNAPLFFYVTKPIKIF